MASVIQDRSTCGLEKSPLADRIQAAVTFPPKHSRQNMFLLHIQIHHHLHLHHHHNHIITIITCPLQHLLLWLFLFHCPPPVSSAPTSSLLHQTQQGATTPEAELNYCVHARTHVHAWCHSLPHFSSPLPSGLLSSPSPPPPLPPSACHLSLLLVSLQLHRPPPFCIDVNRVTTCVCVSMSVCVVQ